MSFSVDLSLCFLICEIRIKRISGSYGSLLYRICQVSGVCSRGIWQGDELFTVHRVGVSGNIMDLVSSLHSAST